MKKRSRRVRWSHRLSLRFLWRLLSGRSKTVSEQEEEIPITKLQQKLDDSRGGCENLQEVGSNETVEDIIADSTIGGDTDREDPKAYATMPRSSLHVPHRVPGVLVPGTVLPRRGWPTPCWGDRWVAMATASHEGWSC